MALYDNILENKNKKVNSANVKENKLFGNTAPVNNLDHTIYPYSGSDANEVNNTLNTRWDANMKPSQYVDQDIQGAGIIMETEDEPITHQCAINTSGDNFGHISDPTGIPIITTKDITCRTSFFTIDLGIQVYQENDWYFPIVQYALNGGCIQCNNNVGCEKCNGCYNRAYSGSECPRCNSACTSGCTTGCTAANTSGMCANCDAGCVGCDNCNAGCTTACTASCVSGCTTACTDCDLEYTSENPETGETCTGCDSCTSCDSCDSCVGGNVDHEIYWCTQCDSHCVGCDGSCNTCTACTSCDGNVAEEQCKNDTSCQSACTNGCAEGCTTAQVSTCLECRGGCNNTCQNNQNGVGDGCKLMVSQDCINNVTCNGQTVSWYGGCSEGNVSCDNNNAGEYDCPNTVTRPCSSGVDYEVCKTLTADWIQCVGNCNTGNYNQITCIINTSADDATDDPTCNDCNGSCTTCDGCVTSCNESCNGCDTCNGCVGCDGGCASCDGCTTACQGCTTTCVSGCASGCQSCVGSSCVSCDGGCYQTCVGCTSCAAETTCSGCTTACQSCTECDGCTAATSCTGCTTLCMTCASPDVCFTCARSCTSCDGSVG